MRNYIIYIMYFGYSNPRIKSINIAAYWQTQGNIVYV